MYVHYPLAMRWQHVVCYSCFPLVTQLTQPDSGEVIITWGTLSPTFSRANFSSAGGWNAWVQKIPWCRPASPCPETRHMVSAGIMRHPDTTARITAIAWIQVWSFKLCIPKGVSPCCTGPAVWCPVPKHQVIVKWGSAPEPRNMQLALFLGKMSEHALNAWRSLKMSWA